MSGYTIHNMALLDAEIANLQHARDHAERALNELDHALARHALPRIDRGGDALLQVVIILTHVLNMLADGTRKQ